MAIALEANQRQHFRIEYPLDERPKLAIADQIADVIDLSESGVKFDCRSLELLALGTAVAGDITFQNGETCAIVGSLVRVDQALQYAVLRFDGAQVPLATMMDEHRRIIRHYIRRTSDE